MIYNTISFLRIVAVEYFLYKIKSMYSFFKFCWSFFLYKTNDTRMCFYYYNWRLQIHKSVLISNASFQKIMISYNGFYYMVVTDLTGFIVAGHIHSWDDWWYPVEFQLQPVIQSVTPPFCFATLLLDLPSCFVLLFFATFSFGAKIVLLCIDKVEMCCDWRHGRTARKTYEQHLTVRFVLWSSCFGDISPCFFFISDNATWVPELHLTRLVLCQWFRVDRAMSVAPMLAFVVASFGTIGEDTVQAFKESAQHWFAIEWGGKGGGDLRQSHRFW